MDLPIERVRADVEKALPHQTVVLSSPTGSGKSTQVPRWCAQYGNVLVIEPRRVACRALATHVAQLERTPLGQGVGYIVRDENRVMDQTRIVFATPGIVLRMLASDERLARYDCVIVDEFHERSIDVDLIVALLNDRPPSKFIIMSATIDGERLAAYANGVHIAALGRTFPVDIQYMGIPSELPNPRDLDIRVRKAVAAAPTDGDILVFAPGKAEIQRIAQGLRDTDFDILPLHGGLSLNEQSRVFSESRRRRVVVSTNVAETSLTVPSIRTVIDTGLVRRTRYHQGRGYLTLMPLSMDSADQRAGRAGRVSHGHCIRLWGKAARLEPQTPPEIHRESVVPLILGAKACGAEPERLRFVDPPPPHALETARAELEALGALSEGQLTSRGEQLFRIPLTPQLGRLIIEAMDTDIFAEVIDLVACLEVGRPLFTGRTDTPEDDLRAIGCDATALIAALRKGQPRLHGLSRAVLEDMRRQARRLRRLFGQPTELQGEVPVNVGKAIGVLMLQTDAQAAYIKRVRKRHVAWSNGGTEIELSNTSAVSEDATDAMILLALRSFGIDQRKTRLVATHAIPASYKTLDSLGLGQPRLGHLTVEKGRPIAATERVYAGAVIGRSETALSGALLQEAVATLTLENRMFKGAGTILRRRLREHSLVRQLVHNSVLPEHAMSMPEEFTTDPAAWLVARLKSLGLEDVADLELLEPSDLQPPDVSAAAAAQLARQWPLTLDLGDTAYDVEYNFTKKVVTLSRTRGDRKDLPALHYLPAFRGFGIEVHFRGKRRVLRPR